MARVYNPCKTPRYTSDASILDAIALLASVYQRHTGQKPKGPGIDEGTQRHADSGFPVLARDLIVAATDKRLGWESIHRLISDARKAEPERFA